MTVSLLVGEVFDNHIVSGNGQFELYSSQVIRNSNGLNSIRVVINYMDNLPDPEQVVVQYQLTTLVESSDGEGAWYPLHYQYAPFVKADAGSTHILVLEPRLFTFDEGVPFSVTDGVRNIAIESKKQGRMSDDFRVRVLVNENGHGGEGAFQSVKLGLHYELYDS